MVTQLASAPCRRAAGHLGAVLVCFLAAVLAFTGLVGGASAASLSTLETRVGVCAPATILAVGFPDHIGAGQHPVRAGPQQDLAQGHGVHTFYAVPTGTGSPIGSAVLVHNASNCDPVVTEGALDHAWENHRFGGTYHQAGQLENVLHPDLTLETFGYLVRQAARDGDVVSRPAGDPRGGYLIQHTFDDPVGLQNQYGLQLAFGEDNGLRTAFPRNFYGATG